MSLVHVAVGIIIHDGQILISQRASHAHQGGLWEFPGGKVEQGETVQQALSRELQEELGILPTAIQPLFGIEHHYSDKFVGLDVWKVSAFAGEPQGMEGQPLKWIALEQLRSYPFPKANQTIIDLLFLSKDLVAN
ncbi:MAG: 8-oxo-dGTP diphosphatase MutT [Gammaproteobacteria bacterium CG22_combo_CG10-13_8_21_14_all_40_8]|nr:MAG: 8-oxo-dGTP diphosphatase MutT [Gammaproteobacteria bacterium CG22_combo_CG10-13_8_21_14_all_40_8]